MLTTVVVLSLTLYTFWAARRGHNFNYLWLTLFSTAIVLFVFAFIQVQALLYFSLWYYNLFVFVIRLMGEYCVCAGTGTIRKDSRHGIWRFGFHLFQLLSDL
jgi:hypothetical protein